MGLALNERLKTQGPGRTSVVPAPIGVASVAIPASS